MTHCTAMAAVPPDELWPPIQGIRRRWDRQVRRWPPHVNLLYPFVSESFFPEVIPLLRGILAESAPFSVRLARIHWFEHRSGNCTMWLDPEPAGPFIELHRRLAEAVPVCSHLDAFPRGFRPHLSIGQVRKAEREETIERLQSAWTPLEWTVRSVVVLARGRRPPEDVFRIHTRLPLGAP